METRLCCQDSKERTKRKETVVMKTVSAAVTAMSRKREQTQTYYPLRHYQPNERTPPPTPPPPATASADDAAAPNSPSPTTHNFSSPSFPCPHPSCHRHRSRPFLTHINLARHLKQQHLNHGHRTQQPLSSTIATTSRDRGSPFTPDQTRSYYCPLTTCNRHVDAFSRGNLLYRHVRKVHPEMDLRELKALEKEKRGVPG